MAYGLLGLFAKLRFKAFRLMSVFLLGRTSGQSIIGQCIQSDLEFANTEIVRDRILLRKLLSEPTVQRYNCLHVPNCWTNMYSRSTVFPGRHAYVLRDVVIGPGTGVTIIPSSGYFANGGIVFLQSVGSWWYLFQYGMQEVSCRSRVIDDGDPVCPMPVFGYYHDMLESLLRVVIARRCFGAIRVLLPSRRPRYIDEMLRFIGVEANQIVFSKCPVRVKRGVLIPRWSDSGENLQNDVCALRDELVSRLSVQDKMSTKIYISRANSRRPLPNEVQIENTLINQGFEVVYFEDIPFARQLEVVRGADVIVAPHGAGLANIIVARKGVKVVEIMTHDWANSCYGHLAMSLGLDYTCIDASVSGLADLLKDL